MVGFIIAIGAAVMGALTAILFAGVGWVIEWIVIWSKARKADGRHQRERVYSGRKGYDHWWVTCFLVTSVLWAVVGVGMFIQSKDEATLDAKHWMTFGYTAPGRISRVEEPVVVTGTEIRRYRLVSYTAPKHFYVTIKDIEANMTYESLYVSKHCNNYATNKLGDDYNIQITHKKQGQKEWIVFNDLYAVFCGS